MYIGDGEKSLKRSMQALGPGSNATMAMAAANWAMWRASERLEWERMSRRSDGTAFAVRTADSELGEEWSGPSQSHSLIADIPASFAP